MGVPLFPALSSPHWKPEARPQAWIPHTCGQGALGRKYARFITPRKVRKFPSSTLLIMESILVVELGGAGARMCACKLGVAAPWPRLRLTIVRCLC
jgi:hypothetical protein